MFWILLVSRHCGIRGTPPVAANPRITSDAPQNFSTKSLLYVGQLTLNATISRKVEKKGRAEGPAEGGKQVEGEQVAPLASAGECLPAGSQAELRGPLRRGLRLPAALCALT